MGLNEQVFYSTQQERRSRQFTFSKMERNSDQAELPLAESGGGSGDDYDARTTKQATSPPGVDDPQQQGQADDKRLQALLAEAGGGGVTTMTSSGSRALRSRRTTSRVEEPRSPGAVEADRAAQQAAKEARARKRRERKWSTTGYVSTKLEMDAMDGGAAGDGDGDDVVGDMGEVQIEVTEDESVLPFRYQGLQK